MLFCQVGNWTEEADVPDTNWLIAIRADLDWSRKAVTEHPLLSDHMQGFKFPTDRELHDCIFPELNNSDTSCSLHTPLRCLF